ncbi:MAG TPA: peptidylprolyl isomerase [Bacteroidales bacterium]|nr:peptidylprolyl isomerase [Bacteroidales bacterium]
MMRIISVTITALFMCFQNISGQPLIVDEVVAVVGDKRILFSDIEQNYLQLKMQGERVDESTRCTILEQMLVQKLLLNQSEVDSIAITDSEVEGELDGRMQYFINAIGSQEKLEEYFSKTTLEIKQDLRDEIRDDLMTRKMRNKITEDISVTPSEVRAYFKSLPEDSLPYINAEVEYNQILIYPKSNEQSIIDVREKLLGIRERITNGESFATLAVIYSEDPGSALKGGDIGWMAKAALDPEYAKAAFALKKGMISKIVESSFGFHLIQCLDRTEDRVYTRHILLQPTISADERRQTSSRLDSIVRLVRLDSLKFNVAAMKYSQDEDSRLNGGQTVNPYKGGTRWEMDEFEPTEYDIINRLKVGEISDPYESTDKKGKLAYKVIWLKERTNPHVGNLKDDYNLFKSRALQKKEDEIVNNWVEDKIKTTYVRIKDKYASCSYSIKGWLKS